MHSFGEVIKDVGINVDLSEIKSRLREELVTPKSFYQEFSYSKEDILESLENYLKSPMTNYNEDTTDLYLFALANSFDLSLAVVKSNDKTCWIESLVEKDENRTKIFFLKTLSQHIDPICRKKSSNCGNNLKQNFKAGEEKNIYSTDSDDSIEITFASYATHVPKVAPKLEEINDNQFTDSCIRCKLLIRVYKDLQCFVNLLETVIQIEFTVCF